MVISNAKIVLLDKVINKGYIRFQDGIIEEIGEGDYSDQANAHDINGQIIFPGFIDIHTHGVLGVDFMNPSVEGIKKVGEYLYKEGVTSFLLTTLTSSHEDLKKVCEIAKEAKETVPSLAGIHLEGPYISKKYKGAQNEEFIRLPNINELKELNDISGGMIKDITLAPELPLALDFIKEASALDITISLGHSNATFLEAEKALEAGAKNITHTHNAMSGYHHRDMGLLGASMYFDKFNCELICDTLHVSIPTIKTFYKIVGPKRIMIITDSLSEKGTDNLTFKLWGLDCIKKNGAAYLVSGPFAGSLLPYDKGVRNMNEILKPSLNDLMRMSSYNQAQAVHIKGCGEIKIGYNADFVILDNNLNVLETYKLGRKVY